MMRPLIDSVRRLRRETRIALAHRRTVRHALGRAFRLTLQAHRESVAASRGRAPAAGSAGDIDRLQQRVHDVIERHPDGIGIRDVGNELGLDWRHVAEPIRALVAAGVVEQIDRVYYAARKASRRW